MEALAGYNLEKSKRIMTKQNLRMLELKKFMKDNKKTNSFKEDKTHG